MKRFISLLFFAVHAIAMAVDENPFFAMDTIARGGPDTVVPLLKELGYAGLGGQAGDEVMAMALENSGLRMFNGYLTISLEDSQPGLSDSLRHIIDRMQNHQAALWLALQKVSKAGQPFASSTSEADDLAFKKLSEIADYAKTRGVNVALYPHTGFWIEKVEDALRIATKMNRADVGVTFNLCHWLKVEGSERDPVPVLKAALPHLMFVTINGAETGDTRMMDWKLLIQPLGSGSYDVATFLKQLKTIGYQGPIGFQGFGIPDAPRDVLEKTMKAWMEMKLSR